MECRQIQEALSAYVDGESSPEEKNRIEGHLPSCTDCSRALAELLTAIGHVRKLGELDPPPWLPGKVMAQVKAEAGKKKGLYERFFAQFLLPRPIHALAAILVLVLSVYVFQTMKTGVEMARAPVEEKKELPLAKKKEAEPAGEVKQTPAAVEEKPSYFNDRDAAKEPAPEKPAAPLPSVREGTTRLQEEVSLENRLAIDKTDDRFRYRGTDTPGEETARMDAEMESVAAGGRARETPGKVAPPIEKEALVDTPAQTAAETSSVESDEYGAAPAGLASKRYSKAMAREKNERAVFTEGAMRIVLSVDSLETVSDQIEKALEELGATVIKKEFPHTERVVIQAMVPRENLTSLTDRLEKIGKVTVETAGVAGEIAPEDTDLVTIEVVSPEENVK